MEVKWDFSLICSQHLLVSRGTAATLSSRLSFDSEVAAQDLLHCMFLTFSDSNTPGSN